MRDGATYLEIDAKILLARLERSLFSFLQTVNLIESRQIGGCNQCSQMSTVWSVLIQYEAG